MSSCRQTSSPRRSWARSSRPALIDLTGGAPELHPRIREIVAQLCGMGLQVQLRTNLTLLVEPDYQDLPELWARQGVRVLASLPSFNPEVTARQRGGLAFEPSIAALQKLNAVGFGAGGLRLDIASNPDRLTLPGRDAVIEAALREQLGTRFGVRFSSLAMLANMPIGRFGAGLDESSRRESYLDVLRQAFNPATVPRLACRRTLAVRWDGRLFDCDFNMGAGLPVRGHPAHVLEADGRLASRQISFGLHCFACTAHAGSS